MIRRVLDRFHRLIGRSNASMFLVHKIYNQLLRCIQIYNGPSRHSHANGEELFVSHFCSVRECGSAPITVFDVGANMGGWARLVRRYNSNAMVHCFECNPCLVPHLEDRYKEDGHVFVNAMAIGAVSELRTFVASETSSELGALQYVDDTHGWTTGSADELTAVETTTIDIYCAKNNIDEVHLIKIDTEGNDFNCILGAQRLISEHRVKAVQFEYGDGWRRAGSTLSHCFAWMESRGYKTYLLSRRGLRQYDVDYWGDFFGYANFVSLSPGVVIHRELLEPV